MKRVLPIALAAPFLLIGAAYPDAKPDYGPVHDPVYEAQPAPIALTYRPCRPGRGDDRCIQLYERGVRASYARWLRDRAPAGEPVEVAAIGGPDESPPPRRRYASRDDHRCNHDADAHHRDARGM